MTEIEQLRAEVAELRRELAEMRGDRTVHHYHHQAQPAPFVSSPTSIPTWPAYYPTTCGGSVRTDPTMLMYNGAAVTAEMSEGGIG